MKISEIMNQEVSIPDDDVLYVLQELYQEPPCSCKEDAFMVKCVLDDIESNKNSTILDRAPSA